MYDLFTPPPLKSDAAHSKTHRPAPMTLRSYQSEALEAVRSCYDTGISRSLIDASTGSGKTVIMSSLPRYFPDLYEKSGMLVMAHRDSLVRQTADKFRRVNPGARIGIEKAAEYAHPRSDLVVASVQTVGRGDGYRMQRLLNMRDWGIVVCDEAHHLSPGSQYDTALSLMNLGSGRQGASLTREGLHRLSLGVTATPDRNDGVGLSHFYDEIAYSIGLDTLVSQGYLCEPVVWHVETGTDISAVQTRGDLVQSQLGRAIASDENRNNVVVSAYLEHASGMTAIAFCVDKEHSRALAATFQAAGVTAASITEDTSPEERRALYHAHNSREVMVLTSVGVLTEGYDGKVDCALMARPTKSRPLYAQMAGRALRTDPSDLGNAPTADERLADIAGSRKPYGLILDFADEGHDLVTAASLYGGVPKYKAKGERIFTEVRERVESAIREAPLNEAAIREAGSFEQVEVALRRRDVLSVANSFYDLKGVTENRWMRVAEDAYQIEVPTGSLAERKVLRVERDAMGRHFATAITPPRTMDGGERVPERRERYCPPGFDLKDVLAACDARIKSDHPGADRLLAQHQPWHMHRPSDGQMRMLRRMGIDTSGVKSKGRASALIAASKMMK